MAGYSFQDSDPSGSLGNILGVPVKITSGLRSPQHNAQVGGVPNSAHLTGQAYDFVPSGLSTSEAAQRLAQSGIPFDQIEDGGDHVHISFAPTNRRQVIKAKMAQPSISDDDLLKALTGQGGASRPVASPSPQGGPTDDELLSALTGSPSAKSTPAASPKVSGKPSYMGREFGFTQEVESHIPFAKDVAAGVPALFDSLTGRSSFGDSYRQNLADYNAAQSAYEEQNPGKSTLGTGIGILASGGPAGGAASAIPQTLRQAIKAGAKGGATLGGLLGFGEAAPTLDERAGNTATGAATGAATGGVLPVVGAVVKPVAKAAGATLTALGEKTGLTNPDFAAKAKNKLLQAFERDQVSATDIANSLRDANGKPLTAMDVGGTNTKRQARNLITQPGEAGDRITKFLGDRAENQSGRVLGDIKSHLSSNTDVYGVAEGLTKQRSSAAAPLYQEAFAGGSTAPLEDQFRTELQAATSAKAPIAKEIKQIEETKAGALAARGAAGAETRARYMDLQEQLKQAEANRVKAMEVFQKAKADGSANAPGAVWNPRIQQFIDDPIIRQGINKGLEVQRLEALAEGKPFNPTEYAVVGENADGTAKVGSVPNMRLLDAAKRGLDDILEGYRDPVTGKMNLDQRGRVIDQVRKSLLKELDSLNPKYKEARAAWSGPSQSNSAMNMGNSFLKADPEEIKLALSRLSDADKDFYRIGAARALQDRARSASDSTDLSRHLFGKQEIREQIEAAFGKGSADQFAKAMGKESSMAHTNRFVLGGSNTANKFADAEDAHLELAQDTLHGLLHGGPKGAVAMGTMGALKRGVNNLFNGVHPEVARHLADNLTATGPGAAGLYDLLAAEQAARSTRVLSRRRLGQGVNRLLAGAAAQASVRGNPQ
jgi:hypothetical protein